MTTIMNNINKMFPSIEKRLDFLSLVTLEYGLSLDSLEELLGVDKETLYQELVKNNIKYNKNIFIVSLKLFFFCNPQPCTYTSNYNS